MDNWKKEDNRTQKLNLLIQIIKAPVGGRDFGPAYAVAKLQRTARCALIVGHCRWRCCCCSIGGRYGNIIPRFGWPLPLQDLADLLKSPPTQICSRQNFQHSLTGWLSDAGQPVSVRRETEDIAGIALRLASDLSQFVDKYLTTTAAAAAAREANQPVSRSAASKIFCFATFAVHFDGWYPFRCPR